MSAAASCARPAASATGSPPTAPRASAAEPGRYHLYVSLACPWAHRTIIVRRLKGLEDVDLDVGRRPGARRARLGLHRGAAATARTRSTASTSCRRRTCARDPDFDGPGDRPRAVGPRDRRGSSTTSRPRSSACSTRSSTPGATRRSTSTRPRCARRSTRVNDVVYRTVNNGVYRAGFATTQAAYEEAFDALFATLDDLDAPPGAQPLPGRATGITEADWRLFTTLRPLRRRLRRPLQVQPAPDRRLPAPLAVPARALPGARASPRRSTSTTSSATTT